MEITILIGCYEINAINKLLQRLIVKAGGKADKIIRSPNNNTLKGCDYVRLKFQGFKCHVTYDIRLPLS